MSQLQLIPKISLTDSSTWIEPTDKICVSASEFSKSKGKAARYLVDKEYFMTKKVIISGIIADESELMYSELLKFLPDRENIVLTTADCATYTDSDQETREEEINFMLEENEELFTEFKNYEFIGLVKGVTAKENEWVFNELKGYCKEFMV